MPVRLFARQSYVLRICSTQFVSSLFTPNRQSKRTRAFAERFKYGVISSTLLSPAFPSTPIHHAHRHPLSPPLPGKFTCNHSRTGSSEDNSIVTVTDKLSLLIPSEPEIPLWPITLSVTISLAALSARFYLSCVSLLVTTLYYMHVHKLDLQAKPDVMTPVSQSSVFALRFCQ